MAKKKERKRKRNKKNTLKIYRNQNKLKLYGNNFGKNSCFRFNVYNDSVSYFLFKSIKSVCWWLDYKQDTMRTILSFVIKVLVIVLFKF